VTDLTFVIIGKNAAASISTVIESVLAGKPAHLASEVLYVDSASTDCTIEIVRRYPVTILQLDPRQPLCAAAGRFIGSRHASGEYICFLDSDMKLVAGWLEKALAAVEQDSRIAAITGVVIDTTPGANQDECRVVSDSAWHGQLADVPCVGGAALFRRSLLQSVGGWNPYMVSEEEPEVCLRLRASGYRIVRLNLPIACHYSPPLNRISTLLARRKRRLYLGVGQMIRYHLTDKLLVACLVERGYGLIGAMAVLAGISVAILWLLTGNAAWLFGYSASFGLVLTWDSIRSRSLYRPLFHLLGRALALEGMVKGFFMRPYPPDQYPGNLSLIEPVASRHQPMAGKAC
jgi:GT2 family glycosyltransferase